MSPVSRGRKGKNKNKTAKSTRRPVALDLFSAPDTCDCPACSGDDFDPRQLIDEVLTDAADLVTSADPLEAEIAGSVFVSIGAMAGEEINEALVGGFIPEFEARACPESVAMLLAIGSVGPDRVSKAASAAASRLVKAGIPRPEWADELSQPVTADECRRLGDPAGAGSLLACSFHRAGRSHAVVVSVDDLDCGAATAILLLETDQLPQALEMIRSQARAGGFEVTEESLDPPELRWQIENALDARAVHDSEGGERDIDELPVDEDDMPVYPAMVALLRARMRTLPAPNKAPAAHGDHADPAGLTPREMPALRPHGESAGFGSDPLLSRGLPTARALPAKRTKSDQPAPIYQLKVGLRGATPPIWRRLQLPADISLARLHRIIQVAFDWDDSHMHVFETPYGEFGIADAELGYHAEAPVTLEQVAPTVRSKIRYTYDFGDDWEHDVVVEKVLDRDNTVQYPRCTGGRRAAPPEDCGGIWGYADLTQALTDPTHPHHEDMLEWLGLSDAADFDPAEFDAQTVTKALSELR
jgi:Plasmid pRiA4b ORF-3-like protein